MAKGKKSVEFSDLARTDALSQLSRYISTTVNANINTTVKSIDRNGILDESSTVQNEVFVNSTVSLFGVEFTEPFYFSKEKTWYCVAYINRDVAYEQYVPQIEVAKDVFYGFYNEAKNQEEKLLSISFYKEAWEKGKEFLTTLEYARLICPDREKIDYEQSRSDLAKIPSEISNALKSILVQLNISGDYGRILETACENSLKDAGFTVAKNGNYIAEVYIENNESGENPLAIYPSVDFKLIGVTGQTLYSYQERISSRTVAYSLETAQKKAYPYLAENIKKKVTEELKKMTETK